MKYRISNDRYSNEPTECTFEELQSMTVEAFGDCGLHETTYRPRVSNPAGGGGTVWGPVTYDVVMDSDGDVVGYSVESLRREEFLHTRHELGLSQSQIAPILGRSLAWIQSMEQGRIECPPYAVYAMRYLSEHPEALG